MKKFGRSRKNRVIFGLCGGIGEYFGIDPTIIRIAFIALNFFLPGGLFLVYIVAGIVVPYAPEEDVTINREQPVQGATFPSDGFDIKNAQDAQIISEEKCGCNDSSFDNTSSGDAHGKSNAAYDEEQFYKESRNDKDVHF